MARGFGVTSGVSNTDSIEIAFNAHNGLRSYGVRYRRLGNAPSLMSLFNKRELEFETENLRWSDQNRIMYSRQFSGGTGRWYVNDADVIGTGHNSLVITYNSSSVANDPRMYANGRVLTVTEDLTPSGTAVINSDNYVIGNRKYVNDECWQGEISDFAIWNAILTPDEALAYTKGFSPLLIRPSALVVYVPLIRDVIDYKRTVKPIVVGTTVVPHPRVLFPQKPATITKTSFPRVFGNAQAGDALVNAAGLVVVNVTGTAAVGDSSVSASGSVIVGVTGTTMAGAASVNANGSVFVDATGTAAAGDASVVATARVLVRANGAVSAGPADVNASGLATPLPPASESLKQWWLGLKLRRGIDS